MNILFPTTHRDPYWLPHIAKIQARGTSTNGEPPPADVKLTNLEPFCWMMTSTGFTVHWPHGTRARVLHDDGHLEGYI